MRVVARSGCIVIRATPPYEECLNSYNSMLCNLPATLQFEKLQRLHEAIQNEFEISPPRIL